LSFKATKLPSASYTLKNVSPVQLAPAKPLPEQVEIVMVLPEHAYIPQVDILVVSLYVFEVVNKSQRAGAWNGMYDGARVPMVGAGVGTPPA